MVAVGTGKQRAVRDNCCGRGELYQNKDIVYRQESRVKIWGCGRRELSTNGVNL